MFGIVFYFIAFYFIVSFTKKFYTSSRYNEGCQRIYDYDREDGTQGADDFTQMLWKGTKKFGIGFSMVDNEGVQCTYVVARYRPTGNVVGAFRDNVAVARDKKRCINPASIGLFTAVEDSLNDAGIPSDLPPKGQFVMCNHKNYIDLPICI